MKKTKNKVITQVSFILDESGSMDSIKESVISGFNKYVKSLQKQKNKFLFTLTKFDSTGLRIPYVNLDIKKIKPLNADTYQPGQCTPLYDAVVETVEKLKMQIKDKQPVLVAIMTDGLENASSKHDEHCLQDLIHKLEKEGNWTFVFMGANQDSWAIATKMGFSVGNIADWQATTSGTTYAFDNLAKSTAVFACAMTSNSNEGVALNTAQFFDDKGGKKK